MTESKEEQLERLLGEGLEHYGQDEVGPAVKAWRAVLDIDPRNAEALDYLQTADRRDQRGLPAAEQLTDEARGLVHEVGGMLDKADWEGALFLLKSVPNDEPAALEFAAMAEIVRSQLLQRYAKRVGNLDSVLALGRKGDDLTRYNLPPDAGFVISLIDGTTPVADLISLSGMDAFDALRIVCDLLDSEIVEIRG